MLTNKIHVKKVRIEKVCVKKVRGFTLTELLTSVVIVTLLASVGLPSSVRLLQHEQLVAASNELLTHVYLARSTAAQYRTVATLCPAPARVSDERCGIDWNAGYRVFADRNGNALLNTPDDTLVAQVADDPSTTIAWRSFRRLSYLQFDATGVTRALNGSFILCRPSTPAIERKIIVNIAGRARIQRFRPGVSPDC